MERSICRNRYMAYSLHSQKIMYGYRRRDSLETPINGILLNILRNDKAWLHHIPNGRLDLVENGRAQSVLLEVHGQWSVCPKEDR